MRSTRMMALAVTLACLAAGPAAAWGPEGHSIIAEIAQRRLTPQAAAMVAELLGRGHSLAAIASWADDIRDERPQTYNWHFVDIPLGVPTYDAKRDCKPDAQKGDCIVLELGRVRDDLRCAKGETRAEALKFAVHFVGDIHQPLHTVLEALGGNSIKVDVFMRGMTCTGTCEPTHTPSNFHMAWDIDLIHATVWDWGHYVDRLEGGWLKSDEAKKAGIDGGTPEQWANETHAVAPIAWNARPADNVLGDGYYRAMLPILDRQLGLAGLRLARFLNEAAAGHCGE
jgi:S1/P1 Nuclease